MNRRHVGAVVAVVAVIAMVTYVILQRETLKAFTAIEPWVALVIVVAGVVAIAMQSLQFKAAVAIHRYTIPMKESVPLTATNTMANYYLPARGGMVVRAAYMKRVHQFPLPEYAALSVLLTVWSILVAALLGILGLAAIYGSNGTASTRVLIGLSGVGVAAVGATALAVGVSTKIPTAGRFAEVASGFRSGISLWFKSKPRLIKFIAYTVLLFAAQALRLWFSFKAIGVHVDIGSMLVIQAMAAVAFVLALTPGNIGIKEGAIVLGAGVLGIDPDLALLASLIDRAAAMLVTFAIGLMSVPYLSRRTAAGSAGTPAPSDT